MSKCDATWESHRNATVSVSPSRHTTHTHGLPSHWTHFSEVAQRLRVELEEAVVPRMQRRLVSLDLLLVEAPTNPIPTNRVNALSFFLLKSSLIYKRTGSKRARVRRCCSARQRSESCAASPLSWASCRRRLPPHPRYALLSATHRLPNTSLNSNQTTPFETHPAAASTAWTTSWLPRASRRTRDRPSTGAAAWSDRRRRCS